MATITAVTKAIRQLANKEKAVFLQRYFKTGKGEYAAGDVFLGITVPQARKIAKQYYQQLPLPGVVQLLHSKYHEERFIALEILVMQFEKSDAKTQQAIYAAYLASTKYINNWDLVDTSAPYLVGPYLEHKSRGILQRLAKSKSIWERRIAMLATYHYIKQGDFVDALRIAELLLNDAHDLIHKAVGWMLREIGNKNKEAETAFLDAHAPSMPRTMLRYAIEKFPPHERKHYLQLPRRAPKRA